MNYIKMMYKNFIQTNFIQRVQKPLGRWRTESCPKKLDYKIHLTNEDHCGPCGQSPNKRPRF